MQLAEELARLAELHGRGELSDAEYESAKRQVLAGNHEQMSTVQDPPPVTGHSSPTDPTLDVAPPTQDANAKRSRTPLIVGVVVVLILVAGAAGAFALSGHGGSGSGPKVAHAMDLANTVSAKGLGCTDAKSQKPDNSFGTAISEEVTCKVGTEDTTIDLYPDHGAVTNAEGLAKGVGCSFAKGFGIRTFVIVVGDNWTISPRSETTARKIQPATGGTVKVIKC